MVGFVEFLIIGLFSLFDPLLLQSIIDASEDSQIEAAIAASLAEVEAAQTKAESSIIAIESDSEDDVDDEEDDDDDDAVETIESDFAFSDSEPSSEAGHRTTSKTKATNGAVQRTSVIVSAACKGHDEVVHNVDDDVKSDPTVTNERTDVNKAKSNGSITSEGKRELSCEGKARTEPSESKPKTIDSNDVDVDVDGDDDIDGQKQDDAGRLSGADDDDATKGDDNESDETSGISWRLMWRANLVTRQNRFYCFLNLAVDRIICSLISVYLHFVYEKGAANFLFYH